MKLKKIIEFIDKNIPKNLALENDEIGFKKEYNLNQDISSIKIFMDLYPEFDTQKTNTLILTHHPPLFNPKTPTYTIHSNWDIINGGANEALAETLKLNVISPFDKTTNIGRICKTDKTFDDFEKMQFQVGEIISCEAVPKSKKLLCSQVKIGSQVKQIVSGIKAHYSPEEMVGKKVMVLVNLKPAKLAGVMSEGMILCAEDAEGNLSLMVPEKKMPAGAEIC